MHVRCLPADDYYALCLALGSQNTTTGRRRDLLADVLYIVVRESFTDDFKENIPGAASEYVGESIKDAASEWAKEAGKSGLMQSVAGAAGPIFVGPSLATGGMARRRARLLAPAAAPGRAPPSCTQHWRRPDRGGLHGS